MSTQFIRDLNQFALSVDIVNPQIMSDVGQLLGEYFRETLRANTFEVRVEGPSGRDGQRFMKTLWSADGREYTAPLFRDDGSVRGHTSYAVVHNKPLWIVGSDDSENLLDAITYIDRWSGAENLPPYRGWGDSHYSTSVIVPIDRPAAGFLNLEFCERLELCSGAKEELLKVVETISIFYRLYDSHRTQANNTNSAIRNLNAKIPHSPLLKPKFFVAFSSRAEEEVVGVIKSVLDSCDADLDVVAWDEIRESGNVNMQIASTIASAEFGVCYFSEPCGTTSEYRDNPNVIFEAGMFQARSSSDLSKTQWIPIREQKSGPAPFDFASDRLLYVPRNASSKLNEQLLASSLKTRIQVLLNRS